MEQKKASGRLHGGSGANSRCTQLAGREKAADAERETINCHFTSRDA